MSWRVGMTARMSCKCVVACVVMLAAMAAVADPLAAPAFSGPLQPAAEPLSFDGNGLGRVYVSGQLTGLAMTQTHATDGSRSRADLSNAQFELQTFEGPLQFYLQAGAYSLPTLGAPYMRARKTTDELYGILPVAYGKAELNKEWNVMAGALPTLIGAESTFSFQNMNIQRGLLWNQEPAISRGLQLNYAGDPLSISVSLTDGFYSGKFNWLTGSVSYALDASNTLAVVGGASMSRNRKVSAATPPAQNNGSILNLIYTHTDGAFTLVPYLQFSRVNRDADLGIDRSAQTYGAAVLAKYTLTKEWSIAGRAEYLKSSGGTCGAEDNCTATNLLYGPGSGAWSLTLTPTWQQGRIFARGDLGYVRTVRPDALASFGRDGTKRGQLRLLLETGILF